MSKFDASIHADYILDLGEKNCSQLIMEVMLAMQRMDLMNNFCINLTRSIDDPDRATVAMVVANASVASGKNTMVFLTSEGVRLAVKGIADTIREEGLQPMADLVKNYVAAGGTFFVCTPCYKKRGYTEADLIDGATLVGAVKLVEFMTNEATGVSY